MSPRARGARRLEGEGDAEETLVEAAVFVAEAVEHALGEGLAAVGELGLVFDEAAELGLDGVGDVGAELPTSRD